MKVWNKICASILTILMCLSFLALFIVFDLIGSNEIIFLKNLITYNIYAECITIAVSVILIALTISYIFSSNKKSRPITLQGENGELIITRETIESIANNVAKSYTGTRDITSKIEINNNDEITVNVYMQVDENIEISELVKNLQSQIKDAVKKATEIEIKNVNVKIRNISTQKEQKPVIE